MNCQQQQTLERMINKKKSTWILDKKQILIET